MAIHTRLRNWTTAACAALALLGVLELLARVLPPPAEPSGTRQSIRSNPSIPELTRWTDLRVPFQRGLLNGVLYETNALGLRSPEVPLAKPPGVYRVALLGDSVVMGAGVRAENTYARILERELATVRPGQYQVINTGLSGLNAIYAVEQYEQYGLRYDPDLAIYGFTVNDIEGPAYRKAPVTNPKLDGITTLRFALLRLIQPGYIVLREVFWPTRGSYTRELRDNYFDNEAAWNDLIDVLDGLVSRNEGRGICTVLCLHTQLITLNALHPLRTIHNRVAEAARAEGILVVDTLTHHMGWQSQELWVSVDDWHPNEKGHRILADALLAALKSLPERCWE